MEICVVTSMKKSHSHPICVLSEAFSACGSEVRFFAYFFFYYCYFYAKFNFEPKRTQAGTSF